MDPPDNVVGPEQPDDHVQSTIEFKKPVLIGRIGKLPRKITKSEQETDASSSNVAESNVKPDNPSISDTLISPKPKDSRASLFSPAELLKVQNIPFPYKEPKWSGMPPKDAGYKFEVIKNGTVIETINLDEKPFYSFGRLAGCDIMMEHPTISRYHAVIQYKAHTTDDARPCGFYLYDLGSSHGTIVNKIPVKPKHYVPLKVGHVIKIGCSTRIFILEGPEDDMEKESELSLTEMKQLKIAKKQQIEEALLKAKLDREAAEKEKQEKMEQDGISWGMADDAEEDTEVSENPYAQSGNEELYLDDPKKTLRGYFEREGLTLEYDCEERGIGQFVCRVELPIEDNRGNYITAEIVHKGKKKDAVIQCALEACKIIDRHGLLRQAKHESRKRKSKNWKDDDFYDSDDDTFLDRTGVIEKKRERRMKEFDDCPDSNEIDVTSSRSEKALTYADLMDKNKEIILKIEKCEKKLASLRENVKSKNTDNFDGDSDALDQFMKNLGKQDQTMSNKAEISKAKMELQRLKLVLSKNSRLADLAKPTLLPELVKMDSNSNTTKTTMIKKIGDSIFIGKKIPKPSKKNFKMPINTNDKIENEEFQVEVDSDEESEKNTSKDDDETNGTSSKQEPILKTDNVKKSMSDKKNDTNKKVLGPMRPPENYVIPDDYYNQSNDRDLPEILDESDI